MADSLMKQYSALVVAAKNDTKAGNRKKRAGAYNEHHIFAKCLSKSRGDPVDNRPSNLVLLAHQEHLEAHKLLHLLYPEHYGLATSYFNMSNWRGSDADPEAYASAMAKHAESMRGEGNPGKTQKNRDAASKRLSTTMRRPDQQKRMRESNPAKKPENRLAQAKRMQGVKLTDETRAKMSVASKGKPKTAEHRASMSGYKWYTDGATSIKLKPGDTVPEGFMLGMAKKLRK